jgi:uncharacterized repeat protein (TIGR01451 family)
MAPRSLLIGALLLLAVPAAGQTQTEPLPFPRTLSDAVPPPAQPLLPPLLYVRVGGPAGMKVTVYRGGERGQTLPAPVKLGLRPGYSYRLALSEIPGFPLQAFYPTLEVRGTLLLSMKLRHSEFPAALNFTEEDFERVQAGAFLKKVVVVERPDRAIPIASRPENPLEVPVPAPRDPLVEGRDLGQPLLLMYFGQRQPTPEELRYQGIPGTVLLPGDKVLGPPAAPPWIVWQWCPVYDPILGPEHPSHFIVVPDGGDSGLPAGHDRSGRLRGLDPSDTVAEYIDSQGRKRVCASNRVELCIPRFVVLRNETLPAAQIARVAPGRTQMNIAQGDLVGQQALQKERQLLQAENLESPQRPSGLANIYGTFLVARIDGLEFRTSLRATNVVDGVIQPPPCDVDLPLLIIKWPDKCGALVGDIVTFSLKYTNRATRPISDVIVSDSLTPRFEYVANSAKTDREAVFTTQPNVAGSTVLRWEFPGALPPGESGLITFQVRVR